MTPAERSALEAWLGPRLAEAPAELAGAVLQLIEEAAAAHGCDERFSDGIPAVLAVAALRGFDGVVDRGETDQASRTAALRLLAADASLTYAFEAAADLGGDVLELAARAGVEGALGHRLRAREAEPRRAAPTAGGDGS